LSTIILNGNKLQNPVVIGDSPALQFLDVTKRYQTLLALDGLNLEVRSGELFGFLGPNGAGKTTAMRLAAGLARPTSGRILVAGVDVQQDALTAKRQLGYVPDNPYIYDSLTGREFLHFCAGLYGVNGSATRETVAELQETFAIGDWIDRRTGQYSHGMKQRVIMASAFLHRPRVILIDEPMVGLDPAGARLVKQVLRAYCRSGAAVFLSTHTLTDAEELCTRIGIINRGQLIACGTLDEIRRDANRLEDAFLSLTAASGG